MASQMHPSPTAGVHIHHGPPGGPPGASQPLPGWPQGPAGQLAVMNEAMWMSIGSVQELLNQAEEALQSYEHALRHNPRSIPAMHAISTILRAQEKFPQAVQYLDQILKIDDRNGEVWGSLGHCQLMMDDLQAAYSAYQQALYHLRDPKEPKLWYGIGILYDRYGSLEHAEEAFSQVMRMQPDFEKSNEIYFRLGIIYKQQQKYNLSLECFRYIITFPPPPLTEEDIWFQIGHVYEQQKDYDNAKSAYLRVLDRDPRHAKVLQQLGWLHHQQSNSFTSQERAIEFLEKSVASDPNDAQSWYLLGRCYMSQQKYPKAYEAYQQAVYRDGRNPTFWCSIGVLYYQINQYRDALDAYSRAIRLNPYISEVWYDLGTLYESCNNQISDALDAYQRAAELDPTNIHIKARLNLLRTGSQQAAAPPPQDVHPNAYQNTVVGPPAPQWGNTVAPAGPAATLAPGPAPAANGPPPGSWQANRLADINPPPQPQSNYDQRDSLRRIEAPPTPLTHPPRAPSPRQQELVRTYHDPTRQGRAMSPHRLHDGPPSGYPAAGLPPPPPASAQPAPMPQRVTNPNYAAPVHSVHPHEQQNGSMSTPLGIMPPFGRGASPRPEVRPIRDDRQSSPKTGYPHQQQYQHHPDSSNPGGIAGGAPTPVAALAAAEAAAKERGNDRPSSVGPKRLREWEEDSSPVKKSASDENRARMDDMHHRRQSTPPSAKRRSSSEVRRAEDQRRANANYHPSEAAHHPETHSLPAHMPAPQAPMHEPKEPHPQALLASREYAQEERRPEADNERAVVSKPPTLAPVEEPERAAREMDVDENYDDDEPEEMKGAPASNGSNKVETTTSPRSNGYTNGTNGQAQLKIEKHF